MPHGTVITGNGGQGDETIAYTYVYESADQEGVRVDMVCTPEDDLKQGEVVNVDVTEDDEGNQQYTYVSTGERANGDVNENGSFITIAADPSAESSNTAGDTGFSTGAITIGDPEGPQWFGKTNIYFACVDGRAWYLNDIR
ncbi:MAG: hypothetical protein ACI837_001511 [Crocinitomicaceae bacterium]|jgi:hypothetical protein